MIHVYTILVILGAIFIPYFTGYLTIKFILKDTTESFSVCFLLGALIISALAFAIAIYDLLHHIIKITIQ
jgi:hypothetical protein